MRKFLKNIVKLIISLVVFIAVLFLVFYFLNTGSYEVAKTVEQDKSIPHIKLDDVILHLEEFGSDTNEVVIVLHGGPGNDYRYLLNLKELSDDYKVVFYDQRGTGLSPRVDVSELNLENMLKDLDRLVEIYSKGNKVNLIGHSWGAMIATAYIAKYPEKVDRVVLAEPGILTNEKALEFMKLFTPKMNFAFLKHFGKCFFQSMHVKGPDKQAKKDYFFTALSFDADPELMKQHPMANYFCNKDVSGASLEYWRYSFLSNSEIMRSAFDENGKPQMNLVDGVEQFENKVLFVVGECNTLIGQEYQEDHMKHFPNAEMVVIKNAGHTMFGENPEQSLFVIRKYFKE